MCPIKASRVYVVTIKHNKKLSHQENATSHQNSCANQFNSATGRYQETKQN